MRVIHTAVPLGVGAPDHLLVNLCADGPHVVPDEDALGLHHEEVGVHAGWPGAGCLRISAQFLCANCLYHAGQRKCP